MWIHQHEKTKKSKKCPNYFTKEMASGQNKYIMSLPMFGNGIHQN